MRYRGIVIDIVKLIESNKYRNINNDEIVERSGFSRSHINRIFKEYVAISIGNYSRMRKLSASAIVLKITNKKVNEISQAFGFSSATSYIIAFKNQFGVTPGKFRERSIWSFNKMIARFDLLDIVSHLNYRIVKNVRLKHFLTTYDLNQILGNLCGEESYNIIIGKSICENEFINIENVNFTYSLCTKEPLSNKKNRWLSVKLNKKITDLKDLQIIIYAGLLPYIGITRNKGGDMVKIIKKNEHFVITEYLIPCARHPYKKE